ncbi:MAG: ABC transporter ATP-binding protein [Bryobacteraceae bacterium]|nr:ABC transporter ATP-binding protein [Bryobacteraceae bacterium]
MTPPVMEVRGLHKRYDDFEAVRGIDFEVRPGEVFGLLGPNGAGKTTTVEILEGIRPRTSGEVRVLGYDPGVETLALKRNIGVALQSTNLPEKMKVREALALFASFYPKTVDGGKLLDRLQLSEKADAYYGTLSGGQKQRVAIALALINDPQVVFFDEPTTGLDPQVRLEIHSLITQLREGRRSILLTTHYIEEAERLCDRVAIVDQGKIIAIGTPKEIQAKTATRSRIDLRTETPIPDGAPPEALAADKWEFSGDRRALTVHAAQPARTLVELVKWIDSLGLTLADIHLKRPTLEDVFIELTGKSLRD